MRLSCEVCTTRRLGTVQRRPNGPRAKLRGQGPRVEADAARGLPACESRDAGRVTPRKLR
jgi:hypothetical protein